MSETKTPSPVLPSEPNQITRPEQLQDTDSTRAAIVGAALDLGCRAAYSEYPGHVRIVSLNQRIAHVGTTNGPWSADIYRSAEAEAGGYQPEATITIPDSHNTTPEGIARYVAGTMAGVIEWRAYASEREAEKANKIERRARGKNPGVRL